MRIETSVEIERPIEEVFDFTTNHVAEWSMTVVEDRVLDEKPQGAGTTFRVVTEERGHRMEFDGVVTRHEPPALQAIEMKGQQFDLEVEYAFEDLGGRTRVTQRSKVHARGFLRAIFFLFGWLLRKSSCDAQMKELSNLKRLLESRESQTA